MVKEFVSLLHIYFLLDTKPVLILSWTHQEIASLSQDWIIQAIFQVLTLATTGRPIQNSVSIGFLAFYFVK